VNAREDATVIPLTRRRHGGVIQAVKGRWATMGPSNSSAGQDPHPDRDRSPLELFAEDIETSLNEIGQTLSDDGTADIFVRTLDILQRALEGSHATGLITAAQLEELSAVIGGMRQAPKLI
jgi:hypothetical protein